MKGAKPAPKSPAAKPAVRAAGPVKEKAASARPPAPRRKPALPPPPPASAVGEILSEAMAKGGHAKRVPAAAAAAEKARLERNREADARLQKQIRRAVQALLDKKAEKLVVLNLQELGAFAEYFVLASATNERQAQAMSDAVEMAMKAEGRRPFSHEGYNKGAWILLDYGEVVFHLFHEEARRFYGLERLWGDAPEETQAFTA
ncbi:MAG TPA: ribosome silencing factor [Thermoanaerobaculia bacterium]|nr:ribosome silencing factor [Thermoanaerobaculia bacterium]